MVSHDTGRFYEPYGITTVNHPNFKRLCKESVIFDRCYSSSPLCAPARSALFTGQPPHQNGLNGLPGERLGEWRLEKRERHLSKVLKGNGYSTFLCGPAHDTTGIEPEMYDEIIRTTRTVPEPDENIIYSDILHNACALEDWLCDHEDVGNDKPFFLQLGSQETHREWHERVKPYSEKGIWKAPYMIDSEEIDYEVSLLQSSTNVLDQGIGQIMDSLEKHGKMENTIFIVTTDHGIDFPRAKGTMFDPGIEVGLFMRYDKGNWKKNIRNDMLIAHTDVYATVLDSCGIDIPEDTDGTSFLSCLQTGEEKKIRDMTFSEKTYHDNYDPIRCLRTDKYKYVFNFDAQTLYDVRIATAPRYNWFKFPFAKDAVEELYDLDNDTNETNNLAKDPEYADICANFRKTLAKWMRKTEDPLLEGSIISPKHKRLSAQMKEIAYNED